MASRLVFSEYSDVMQKNFADINDIKTFNKICIDTYNNKLQGQTTENANAVIRNKMFALMGLEGVEAPTERQIKRAFGKQSVREAIFEVIELTIENALITGWTNDPWFKKFVEFKTMALGQKNNFYIKADNIILNVSEISGGHHNIERQRLNRGEERSVRVRTYGVKVYAEMVRFLMGVEDWTTLINEVTRAFDVKTNNMIHTQVMSASQGLPQKAKWNQKGLATKENKKSFKQLIADVKRANGSDVMIMGTEVALGELTGFGDVNWISTQAKDDVYRTGRIGMFEGTTIVEIPQAFEYNNELGYLEDDDLVLIMPTNIDSFVKFYFEGTNAITEHTEAGQNGDDTKDYELQIEMGVETILSRRFGVWKFEA